MEYRQAKKLLNEYQKSGCIPGLDNMTTLCRELGNPQECYKTIHIAGTNGKGSVGLYLSSALSENGYRTGHYCSPAVADPLEIIQINGINISENDCAFFFEKVINAAKKCSVSPTAFEIETAICFLYFKEKNVDIAVIECGLGGKDDATNVLKKPLVCVFTSIGMDHMNFLGNTAEEITKQKCGIIKKNTSVAAGCNKAAVNDIISLYSQKNNADIHFVNKKDICLISCDINSQVFSYKNYNDIKLGMTGSYQTENAALALETITILNEKYGFSFVFKKIKKAFLDAKIFGRFTVIPGSAKSQILHGPAINLPDGGYAAKSRHAPIVIADGAHNPDACARLDETVNRYFKNKKVSFICGFYKDKDYRKCLESMDIKKLYTISTKGKRGLAADNLCCTAKKCGISAFAANNPRNALLMAYSDGYDIIISFGSLSYLAELKNEYDTIFSGNLKRASAILRNDIFISLCSIINENEKERKFCRHGLDHFLDTAWVCSELAGERNMNISTDIIYAAALVHDLGRAYISENIPHEIKSAEIAQKILPQCGFTMEETETVKKAVICHSSKNESGSSFEEIFSLADKLSRRCSDCPVYSECNWSTENKNHTLKYLEEEQYDNRQQEF